MEVKQVYEIVNTASKEYLGEETILQEDLSNIADIGEQIQNLNALDNWVRSLFDHIGKVICVDRIYKGRVPSVLKDGWEFGAILEKISTRLPEATENESWELEDGASYDENIFTKPQVTAKFWNKRVTFEVPMSFAEKQVKSAFSNAQQMNAFVSMIYTSIKNSMTVKFDALIMRTINNFIADTVYDEYEGANLNSKSGVRAVNLLYLFNNRAGHGSPITAEQAISDTEFQKFATQYIGEMIDKFATMSTLFNMGAEPRFTPTDKLHLVLHSKFKRGADVYLQADTFHNELTALPNAETVAFWQGSGTGFNFADTSKIDVKTSSNHEVQVTGIIGVMFDGDALGVTNENPRVTSKWNAKAEFFNEWHKTDAGFFNDYNENFVVFFVA